MNFDTGRRKDPRRRLVDTGLRKSAVELTQILPIQILEYTTSLMKGSPGLQQLIIQLQKTNHTNDNNCSSYAKKKNKKTKKKKKK